MKTLLSVIIKVGIFLVVLFGVAFFALTYFASPERLKPYAINLVKDKYQRTLSVGDIHWRVFPKLGLSLEDVKLSDNPAFGDATFAAMKTVSVFVDTLSLLRGHLAVNTVEFVDVKADLKTSANGVNSWDDLSQPQLKTTATAVKTENGESKGLSISEFSFNIEKIEIQNGQFNYVDEKSKSNYKVTDLSFKGENIQLEKAFPVSLSFDLASTAPAVKAKIAAKASVTVPTLKGKFDPKTVKLEGTVDIPSLNTQGIQISSLKAPVTMSGGVVKMNNMSASFYGGKLGGSATVDASDSPMRVSVNYDLSGVNMGSMLKDLDGKDTLTGTLNMKGNLSFKTSPDKKQVMQSLDGKGQMNVKNGVLKGIDLAYFYSMGSNLINPKNLIASRSNSGQTDFQTTSANFTFSKGILNNPDLVIYNSGIYGSGAGTVNLVSDQVNYRFRIQGARQGANGIEPVGTAIPLQITGSTSNPTIGLDISASLLEGVKQGVLQGLSGKTVQNGAQGIGGAAGQILNVFGK